MTSLAHHANRYSSLGWALVELDGKSPKGHGWQKAQPLDPLSAEEIWQRRSGNMGIVLGPSGVIDYEMDAGELEDFLALVGGDIPETPAFRTGTGKLHILFRDPGGLSRTTRDGFELRAGPHQSVLPPSVHPDTGEPYEWVNDPETYELIDPPDSLLTFFQKKERGQGGGESHWAEALRGTKKLGEGEGRHASMISFLGKMVTVLDNEEQLVAAALMYAELTQDPPYPDSVVTQQALDVWHRYRDEEAAGNPEDADAYLGIRRLDRVGMRSVEFLWKPFLQRSAFHLLVGRKGAGKGSLLAWIAAQVTTGQIEGDEDPRTVLWISTEDSFEVDVKPRFIAQGGDPRLFLTASRRVRLPDDLDKIEAVAREHGVGMIVIDPIVGVIGAANTNDEGAIVAAIGGLNDLADRLDLMVIGVRHLGKNLERGVLESVLGSAAWVNTPRAVLGIAQEEDSKVVTLQVLAGNRSGSRASYDFALTEHQLEGLEEPVSKVVPKGFSHTDVQEVLSKQPKDKKSDLVRDLVLELVADGTPMTKESLIPIVFEKVGAGKTTVDRVMTDLKESGQIRWLSRPRREDGTFETNAPWYFTKAI